VNTTPLVSVASGVATTNECLDEGMVNVGNVSPSVPGDVFAVAGSADLGSDTRHGVVATDTINPVEVTNGNFATVRGNGVFIAGDVDASAT